MKDMKTEEIIRENELSTDQMIFVVEQYVKEKKSVDVDINLMRNLNPKHPFFTVLYSQQLTKLNAAYGIAAAYFFNKEDL